MDALNSIEILSDHIEITNQKLQQKIKDTKNISDLYDYAVSIEETAILIKGIMENN